MNEWKEVTIEEIKANSKGSIAIGPFGSRLKSDNYISSGIPVIRGTNISSSKEFSGNFVYISKEKALSLGSANVYPNDLVFPHRGAIGEVGLVNGIGNSHYVISSSLMKLTLDLKKADPNFLFYFFKSNTGRHELLKNASTVGTPGIGQPLSSLKSIRLNLPPLPEQKAIAHILGSLDDKIELNRKMNQTLEAMAQALFKSWFVDFDPVLDNALAANNPIPDELEAMAEKRRSLIAKGNVIASGAKQSRRLIDSNPALAALFPSSFVFNETLGKWIPKGWEVKTIDDAATVVGGGTPSTKVEEYFCVKGIPWLSPKDLSGYEWKYISKGSTDITEIGLKNSSAKLMPKGTVLFSSRAPIGYIAIAENEISTNQGFKSLVPDKGIPSEYLFQFLKANTDKIDSIASGSTFKEVSGSALKGIEIIIPSKKVLIEFSKVLSATNSRALVIQKETETLTQLRDTLLPELINGRVRVKEGILNQNF